MPNLRAISVLLIILSSAIVSSDCRGETSEPADPSPEATVFHDLRSPEQYFDLVPATLIDRFTEAFHLTSWNREQYVRAVAALREKGPEGVSAGDWPLIMAVTWYAYIAQAHSIKTQEILWDAGCTIRRSRTEQTQYDLASESMSEMGVPSLVAVRIKSDSSIGSVVASCSPSVADPPTYCPTPQPIPIEEQIEVLSFEATTGAVSSTRWTRDDRSWECRKETQVEGFQLAMLARVFLGAEFAYSTPTGTETARGRQAYKLRAREGSLNSSERPISYWMDAETLLPLQYEYSLLDACRSGGGRRITILEVNGEVNIDPPEDVACD